MLLANARDTFFFAVNKKKIPEAITQSLQKLANISSSSLHVLVHHVGNDDKQKEKKAATYETSGRGREAGTAISNHPQCQALRLRVQNLDLRRAGPVGVRRVH